MTEAQLDLQKQIRELQAKFKEKVKDVNSGLTNAVTKSCLLIERTAKLGMQNTQTDSSKTYRRGHHPSIEGDFPAIDEGTLVHSITHDIKEDGDRVTGRVGSTIVSPPYGAYLENGTSRMAPRPWLLPSIDQNKDEIKTLIQGVIKGRTATIEAVNVSN